MPINTFDSYILMHQGQIAALQEASSYSLGHIMKIEKGQETFFKKNQISEPVFVSKSDDLLSGVTYRYLTSAMVMEQLHSVRNSNDFRHLSIIKLTQQSEGFDYIIQETLMDQYLLLSAAFIDYYLRYTLYFLTKEELIRFNVYDILNKLKESNNLKANQAYEYLTDNVLFHKEKDYSNTNLDKEAFWGTRLKDLRNMTAHERRIELALLPRTNSLGVTKIEPHLQNQSIAHFLQTKFDNNILSMLTAMHPILYGVEWGTGIYYEGMYD